MLEWISDWVKRLKHPFDKKHFLKTIFLYVRRPGAEIIRHINRGISDFNELECDVLVAMGWGQYQRDVNDVSIALRKRGRPVVRKFRGYSLFFGKKTFSVVHKKNINVIDF